MPDDPPVIPISNLVDLAIVGAGPIGMFGAFYAGMRQMSVKVLDAHSSVGGQLSAFYPTDPIYDVPGFTRIPAEQLALCLFKQAGQAMPTWCLSQEVQQIHPITVAKRHVWQLNTSKATHYAKAVMLALGVGAIRAKPIAFLDPSVRYANLHTSLNDLNSFRAKDVVLAGQGARGIQDATALLSVARKVTLVCPSKVPSSLVAGHLTVVPYHQIVYANSVKGYIGSVIAEDVRHRGRLQTLSTDALLCHPQLETSLKSLLDWGLHLDAAGIHVNPDMSTNLPGVYAVGDIAAYSGKVKLIAVGFGEAANGINHIKHFLDASQKVFPGYSTSVAPRRLPSLADEPS